MKKYLVLFITTALIYSCSETKDKTLIMGEISNPVTDKLVIVYFDNYINYEDKRFEIKLDENNNFSKELDLNSPISAYFGFKDTDYRDFARIIIEPGDHLEIKANGQDFANSITFSGDNADNSVFYNRFLSEVKSKYREEHLFNEIRELEPKEFYNFTNEISTYKNNIFDKKSKDKDLSNWFLDYFNTYLTFENYNNLFSYPYYHKIMNQLEETPELPEEFYDAKDEAMGQLSDDKLFSEKYSEFLRTIITFKIEKDPDLYSEKDSFNEKAIKLANELFEGKTREYAVSLFLYQEFNRGDFDIAKKHYYIFKEEASYSKYLDILSDAYDLVKNISPGSKAPSFELKDIKGNKVSLKDFRGKVVYLDFWASWCGPCIREIPHAKELKDFFKDEDDLVFLYVSLDREKEAWKNAVISNEIKGVHLYAGGFDNEVANSYNVKGIPSYFIIDRNGIVFDNNAKRPSNEGLVKDLEKVLEQEYIASK